MTEGTISALTVCAYAQWQFCRSLLYLGAMFQCCDYLLKREAGCKIVL
jgi:hypothetical protein